MKKVLIANLLVTAILLAGFDVICFFFLPSHYSDRFPEYRRGLQPIVAGRQSYPRGYFVEHESRGFDIGEKVSGSHWVDGFSYPIWSNSLGCFDREHDPANPYVYFAGDSFTWGYTPYEDNFGTLVEQETGSAILKCGVTHTGQRHQFDKMVDIASRIGQPPKAIVVFVVSNDVANDYVHPHTTVIDGWQANDVFVDDNYDPVRLARQTVELETHRRIAEIDNRPGGPWQDFKSTLKRYSLTVNILVFLKDRLKLVAAPGSDSNAGSPAGQSDALQSFYSIPSEKEGRYWYRDNPRASNNKAAIADFAEYARGSGAELVVVLIPHKAVFTNTDWFSEVREFLSSAGVRFVDLTFAFQAGSYDPEELHWPSDGHPNQTGNAAIANILLEELGDVFAAGAN